MYKILIADNEGIVVSSLRHIITEAFPDSCDIRTTTSSRRLFDVYEKYHPDILFLNVQMNGVHGVFTLRGFHSIDPDCVFIVLSSSSRTNYEKEGSALPVTAYLTRPFSKEIIVEATRKAFSEIRASKGQKQESSRNLEKIKEASAILENAFISEILLPDCREKHTLQYRDLFSLTSNYAYALLIEFCDGIQYGSLVNPLGSTIQLHSQFPIFRKIVKTFFPSAIIGYPMANRVTVIIPCPDGHLSDAQIVRRQIQIERLSNQLEKKLHLTFFLQPGCATRLRDLTISVADARAKF